MRGREWEGEGEMVGWNPDSATKSVALTKLFNTKSLNFLVYKVITILPCRVIVQVN